MPGIYLEQTPAPVPAHEDTITDIQFAVYVQEADKALAACNADKEEISKLVRAQ